MKKKILLVLAMLAMLVCLLAISVSAAEYTDENGIKYTTNSDDTATVADSRNTLTATEVIIAEKITVDGKEYTVTSVAENAFRELTSVTTIYFPPTITKLTGYTFCKASSLEKVYIDFDKLTSVGHLGFTTGSNGSGYSDVKTNIAIYATSEYGKETPTQTTVANFENITNIGQAAFQGLNVSKIIIGNKVTSFAVQSFRGSTVTELVLNCSSVTTLPSYSFDACASLSIVDASKVSFETIGSHSLSGTKSLTSLTLDFSKIKRIEGNAFAEAGASTSVNFASNIDISNLEYLGGSAFKKSKLTGDIVIPANCSINDASYAFENVPITSVVIESETLTKIPTAFMTGTSLSSIVVKSKKLVTISDSAFGALQVSPNRIVIDLSKVTTVGGAAFEFTTNCQGSNNFNSKTVWCDLEGRNLVNLKNVTSIGSEAFGTSNVGSAHIIWPDALTSISYQAFRKANLKEVYLNAAEGSSITAEYWAFNGNPIELFVVGQGVTLSNQLEAQCTVVLLSETTISDAKFITKSGSTIYYTTLLGDNTNFTNAEMIPITGGTATSTACGIDCSVTLASDSSTVIISVPVHTWDNGVTNEAYCPIGAVVDFNCIYCDAEKTEGEGTEHDHSVAVIVYENGFMQAGVKTMKCSNTECTSILDGTEETVAIFTFKGFAYSTIGEGSMISSFAVNQDALEAYNKTASSDEQITEYGLVAATQSNVGSAGNPFAEGVKNATVNFFGRGYDIFEMKINGMNDNSKIPVYCTAYITVGNKNSFFDNNTLKDKLETAYTFEQIKEIGEQK